MVLKLWLNHSLICSTAKSTFAREELVALCCMSVFFFFIFDGMPLYTLSTSRTNTLNTHSYTQQQQRDECCILSMSILDEIFFIFSTTTEKELFFLQRFSKKWTKSIVLFFFSLCHSWIWWIFSEQAHETHGLSINIILLHY